MQSKYITEHIKIKKRETKYEDIHKSSTFKKNSGLEETLVKGEKKKKKKKINILVKNGGKKQLTTTIYPNTLICIAELKLV